MSILKSINNTGNKLREMFGEPKSMEFLKNLLLVILVPLVVSSLSFASNYGGQQEVNSKLVETQATILAELRAEREANIPMRLQVATNRETLLTTSKTLSEMKGAIMVTNEQVKILNRDIIPGGAQRVERLESILLQN